MIPSLREAVAASSRNPAKLNDDALAAELEEAGSVLRDVTAAAITARSDALNFEAIQRHAENRQRALEHEERARALAAARAAAVCQVPGCQNPPRTPNVRVCSKHRVADIEEAREGHVIP